MTSRIAVSVRPTPPGQAQWIPLGNTAETGRSVTARRSPSDRREGVLTLVKTVTNDNGGTATVTNFPLTATGPRTISGVSGTTAVTSRRLMQDVCVDRETVANYTAGSWSCTGGTLSGGEPDARRRLRCDVHDQQQ
jgi:hypothetical protein